MVFPLGDPHNFGLRVSIDRAAIPFRVKKPRCMFWEYEFLDSNSPLRLFLRSLKGPLETALNIDKVLGAVEIKPGSTGFFEGEAEYIQSEKYEDTISFLESFGELCGLALVFGITDLHIDNIVISSGRPQIIDVEAIFWDSQLISESLLIPKLREGWDRTLAGLFLSVEQSSLPLQNVLSILIGYCRFMDFAMDRAEEIKSFLKSRQPTYQLFPIRLLLRPTREYRAYLSGAPLDASVLEAERVQISRGDIPYFFGFSGSQQIYYRNTPTTQILVDSLPKWVQLKAERAFAVPASLFLKERIEKVYKQGLIELVAKLSDNSIIHHKDDDIEIGLHKGILRVETQRFRLQTNISRTD